MALIPSFFNVNPFSTQIGQKIEQATDASLASENWALNIEICDMINESSDTARDAMKAIKKRLTQNAGKNYTVIMYTLTVLETCVKNCGKPLHLLVASKEFIQELVKLIGPKNDPPAVVQEKVLSLIQIWADAFRKQPDLNGVVQVYQELKTKGIEFPMTDLDNLAPIFTPQRSVPEPKPVAPVAVSHSPQHIPVQIPGSPAVAQTVPTTLSPDQIAKLQSELDIVSLNMSIFGEMLTVLKPGHEDPDEYKLLIELASTCKEMQGRIVELIGKISLDEFTAELLRLNDELNNLFLRHARYENNRDPNSVAAPSAILGAAMGIPGSEAKKSEQNKDSLIDLSDEAAGGDDLPKQFSGMGLASSQLSQINTVTAQSGAAANKDIDEFDMLAQSRKAGIGEAAHLTSGTTQKDEPIINTNPSGITAPMQREHEPHEDDNMMGGPEESVTSKEFEKFLAERAAAADNLPTIPSQTGPINSTQKHKKDRKDDDALLAL